MENNRREIYIGEAEELTDDISEEVDLNQIFEWNADEFEYYEKGKNWKWGLIVVSILFFGLFLLTANYTAMLLVIVGALVIYQYAFKRPRKLHYIVSRDGITIGEKLARFNEFKNYWISADGFLYFNKQWPPRLAVKLDSVDVNLLDDFISNFLDKVDRSDRDTGDKIGKVLKL